MFRIIAAYLALAGLLVATPQTSRRRKATTPQPTTASASSGEHFPIKKLTVLGLHHYTEAQILGVARLSLGMQVSDADLDAAQERLSATAAFEYVGYTFQPSEDQRGYYVEFEITEMEQMYPIAFEDLPVPDAELKDVLRKSDPLYSDPMPASDPVMKHYVRVLEMYLSQHGFKQKIGVEVFDAEPEKLTILFRPNVPRPNIAGVEFSGSKAFTATKLKELISPAAVGMPYSRSRFLLTLDAAIRPLYDSVGLVRVKFLNLKTTASPQVVGVIVHVDIEEGAIYHLYDVRVDGSPIPVKPLLAAGDFMLDKIADFTEVNRGKDRMLTLLRRHGYVRCEAEMEREIDDNNKRVTAVIHISGGPAFAFGKLDIKGLDLHGDDAVRRLWTMKPGQPYDDTYPAYFLQEVQARNMFDDLGKTKVSTQINDAARTVDVTLEFLPKPPQPKRRPGQPENPPQQ